MLFLSFSLIGFQIQIREYRSFPPFSDCPSHPPQSRPCKSSVVDYMKQTFVPRSKLFQGRAFDAVCRRRRRPFQRVRSKWPTAHSLGITLQIELQRVTSFASILGHWHVWPFPPSWPIGIEKLHTPPPFQSAILYFRSSTSNLPSFLLSSTSPISFAFESITGEWCPGFDQAVRFRFSAFSPRRHTSEISSNSFSPP